MISRGAAKPHAPPTMLTALWSAALVVAGLGTWLLFRAQPGINWALVTLTAALLLVGCARRQRRGAGGTDPGSPALMIRALVTLSLALALTLGAAFTADAAAHVLIAMAAWSLLAIGLGLARDPLSFDSDALGIVTLPFRTGARLAVEFLRRLDETLMLASSSRSRPLVRGVALALPVVVVFGLMLAPADPLLASARDQVVRLITSWEAVPRVLFFSVLLVVMVGACGLTARGALEATRTHSLAERTGIGAVERTIVLGAVTLLFAGFLVLQLAYLFGNLPATVGSGVTFAEYARRGFAELTIVASLCLGLIAVLDHGVSRGPRNWRTHVVELVLLGELVLLLASAFRRLLLYEDAYGFTIARLYGQAYMVWLAAVLGLVALELRRRLDVHRLIRRAAVAGALMLTILIYWNHEAWIVHRNVARATPGRQLDARYAVWWLSPNAVPALVAALDQLPPDTASALRVELTRRHGAVAPDALRWFEWNLRRVRAQRALSELRAREGRSRLAPPDSEVSSRPDA
jgi:Domain of unknown function (DUF4173)